MASSAFDKNGYKTPPAKTHAFDIKIVVVGEPRCGKSTFIQTFYDDHRSGDYYAEEGARVYLCKYLMLGEMHPVKICEIVGGPDEIVDYYTGKHTDANGFILMYAIDDPESFQRVTEKWYPSLNRQEANMWKNNEPAIVVGTKRDLRNDPQVIQRLAQNNQTPVTEAQGRSLVRDKIRKYFDCSSTPEYNVHNAFFHILSWGLDVVNNEKYGYAFSNSNADADDS